MPGSPRLSDRVERHAAERWCSTRPSRRHDWLSDGRPRGIRPSPIAGADGSLARVFFRVRFAATGRDQPLQTPVDVEAPSARARLEALELRHAATVRESHLGLITVRRDLEGDVGACPLVRLLGEVEERFLDVPDDSLVRDELADLLLRVVDVLVAIGELGTERVGVPFD